MLQEKLDSKMRLFFKIFAVLCGILLVIVFIESKNRKEFKISPLNVDTYVVSWHRAYYDTMGNWDVNNGSVILKVDQSIDMHERDKFFVYKLGMLLQYSFRIDLKVVTADVIDCHCKRYFSVSLSAISLF